MLRFAEPLVPVLFEKRPSKRPKRLVAAAQAAPAQVTVSAPALVLGVVEALNPMPTIGALVAVAVKVGSAAVFGPVPPTLAVKLTVRVEKFACSVPATVRPLTALVGAPLVIPVHAKFAVPLCGSTMPIVGMAPAWRANTPLMWSEKPLPDWRVGTMRY